MRLLVTKSNPLHLVSIPLNKESPQYAILSHTWGGDEVTFEDMQKGVADQRSGYAKLKASCDIAAEHGYDYLWADTCCIDKSSSSELQEAICSMFAWYKNASICYVYLEDYVHAFGVEPSLHSCRWFSRGWTLQELIAPKYVEFFDKEWTSVGTKHSLLFKIVGITMIDKEALQGSNLKAYSVAERMSWASRRETTRVEDRAYSLMGIFDVFMPMLYGEGNKAFMRLQEEIMKQTEDYTLFAWVSSIYDPFLSGILAKSPADFPAAHGKYIVPRDGGHKFDRPSEYLPPTLNSRGVMLTVPLMREKGSSLAWVGCESVIRGGKQVELNVLCIRLKIYHEDNEVYVREKSERLDRVPRSELRKFRQSPICVSSYMVSQSGPASDHLRVGRSDTYASYGKMIVKDAVGLEAPSSLLNNSISWWVDDEKSLFFHPSSKWEINAAISFGLVHNFVVIVNLSPAEKDIAWCRIVNWPAGYGETSLSDLRSFLKLDSNELRVDRSEKTLADGRHVTAAVRPTGNVPDCQGPMFILEVVVSDPVDPFPPSTWLV